MNNRGLNMLVLLFMVLCPYKLLFSQVFDGSYGTRRFTSELYIIDEYIKFGSNGIDYNDLSSYKGTPYSNPNYLLGNIYKDDKLLATNIAIRYNVMEDEMEIKESINTHHSEAKVLPKNPNIYVKIVNDIYIFAPYKGQIEGGGYFQVLLESKKKSLFKKNKKTFTPSRKATTSLTKDIPASFKDKSIYYLVDEKGIFYEIPNPKNKRIGVFGNKKEIIKNYITQNNLDINEEKDLICIIKYYNGL